MMQVASVAFALLLLTLACIVCRQSSSNSDLQVREIAFSPNGEFVAFFGLLNGKPAIPVYDARTKKALIVLERPYRAGDLAFPENGDRLVCCGEREIVYWNTKNWEVVKRVQLSAPPETIRVKLSPDGRTVAFEEGLRSSTVKLWDALDQADLFSITLGGASIGHAAFSPDGKLIAVISVERIPGKVVDLRTRQVAFELVPAGNDLGMDTTIFSGDGARLAVGERIDCSISIWNIGLRKREKVLHGHEVPVDCLAFSPDGKLLASGSSTPGELKVWNVNEEKEVFSVTFDVDRAVSCLAFSPDGKTLAYGLVGRPTGALEFLNVEDLSKGQK